MQDDLSRWISKRIEDLREIKGVSAREMSRRIIREENYIRRIETGKMKPSLPVLHDICQYLGISLKDFFEDESENPMELNEIIRLLKTLKRRELDCIKTMTELLADKRKN